MQRISKKIVAIFMAILLIPLSEIVMATMTEEPYPNNYYVYENEQEEIYPEDPQDMEVDFEYEEDEMIFIEDIFESEDFISEMDRIIDTYIGREINNNQIAGLAVFEALYSQFPTDRFGNFRYPSFYGGSYFNEEGHPVFLIVETDEVDNAATFRSFMPNMDGLNTRFVQFPFGELERVIYEIVDLSNELSFSAMHIVWLDVLNNRVVVELENYSPEQIELFKTVIIDSPVIEFYPATSRNTFMSDEELRQALGADVFDSYLINDIDDEAAILETRNNAINPGRAIFSQFGGQRSMGFRAVRSGRVGFVTARHRGMASSELRPNDPIRINSTTGTIIGSVITASPVRDAAFIEVNFNGVPTNMLPRTTLGHESTLNNNTSFTPRLNQRVFQIGSATGLTNGLITGTSRSMLLEGQNVIVIAADYRATGGDSGGTVFVQTSTLGRYDLAGIHSGVVSATERGFVGLNGIMSTLSLSR